MNLLAFDASGEKIGVAVSKDGRIYSIEFARPAGRKESLQEELAAALKKARLPFAKLDAVAAGLGPGSFTGLRIAVTTAKTLAWAGGVRLFGFSTLEALAASGESERAVILEAGRGNVYAAQYAGCPGKSWRVVQKPRLEKKTAAHRLTPFSASAAARGLAELALKNPSRGAADPFRMEPLYLYPRDCNVTLA